MGNYFLELKRRYVRLLRGLEQYTKTDMVYVMKGGFWSFLSQGASSASSALAVIILANLLSKESFGHYRLVLSIASLLSVLALPGINTAFMRSIARGENVDSKRLVKTEIRWGLFSSLVALFIAFYYFLGGTSVLAGALVLTAILLPFLQPFSIYSSYYKGKQDFKTAMIYDSAASVFQSAALIIVALITKSVLAALGAFMAGQIVSSLFFYLKTLRDEKALMVLKSDKEDQSAETIKYGKSLTATQIVGALAGNIDKLFVGYFLGAEILAVYSVALTIPNNIILLFNVIPRIALPKFARNAWEADERSRVIYRLFIFIGALLIPALIYFLLVPHVIPLIFKNYSASIPVAVILSFLILISPVNAVIDGVLTARKLVKRIIFSQTVTLITFVGAFFLMYLRFGPSPVGAAVALIISEVVQFLFGLLLLKR